MKMPMDRVESVHTARWDDEETMEEERIRSSRVRRE